MPPTLSAAVSAVENVVFSKFFDLDPSWSGVPELPLFQLREVVKADAVIAQTRAAASAAIDVPSAEIDFDSSGFEPAAVGPDMLVAVRFEDDNRTRVVQISSNQRDPDNEIIHVDQPLARALVGGAVDDTVELVLAGPARGYLTLVASCNMQLMQVDETRLRSSSTWRSRKPR